LIDSHPQTKLNQGQILATSPYDSSSENKRSTLMGVGDTVLLPEYGGMQVKLGDKDSEENVRAVQV
jgi:co-chaperonin GroES (HSP10)